ncbi:MAG TPA: hypothetical protein VGR27_15100 [Longimicrobiaceae bacterium]|nr:hypothetical protein [Longimicrobiaceae bacterium]
MKIWRAAVVPLALLLSIGACAPKKSQRAAPHLQRAETTVRVTNNNWATVVVYLVRSGPPTRLGTVTSMRTEVLRVPRSAMPSTGSVQLMVDPIGSRHTYTSPVIQVGPGQQIEFNIENQLSISSISVWE